MAEIIFWFLFGFGAIIILATIIYGLIVFSKIKKAVKVANQNQKDERARKIVENENQ